MGIDILAEVNEKIFAPMDCDVIREAFPYKDSKVLRGVLLKGTGPFAGYGIKLFYVNGLYSGHAKAGELIGHAMSLQHRYPGISNHIHMEVYHRGEWVDPRLCFPYCF